MPEHFDIKGRARSRKLSGKIVEARRFIREGNSVLSSKLYSAQQKSQKEREAAGFSIIVNNHRPSPNENPTPGCEQCPSSNRKCDLWESRVFVGQACGACLRKGELCSLSSLTGGSHKTLRTGTKRNEPRSSSAQRVKHIRKVTQPALLQSNNSAVQEIVQQDVDEEHTGRNQRRKDSTGTQQNSSTTCVPHQDVRGLSPQRNS